MDLDHMGSGPDIDNLDVNTLDLGNELIKPESPKAEPPQEELEQEVRDANREKEPPQEEPSPEEQPRDDKGRFTEKEARIPKSRFDEAVGKEREAREAAERRAQELERQLAERAAKTTETEQVAELEKGIEALEVQYQELLLDGNTAEAAKIMRQIRVAERQIATAEAESKALSRTQQVLEQERFSVAVARLEADYPELNPQSEVYDQDLVDLVLSKQGALIRAQGMSPSEAIAKAADDVAKRFLVRKPAEPEKKGLAPQADRTKQAVDKALTAQKSQPPSLKEAGMDSDKLGEKELPDVTKMTADEFDALPEATKARLMGNLV